MSADETMGRREKPARVIICGSRDWTNVGAIEDTMVGLHAGCSGRVVFIHGDARGADKIADAVARRLGFDVEAYPADWRGNGKGAGPIRNRQMLDTGATLVVAFKEGFDHSLTRGGTENMVRMARAAGIPTIVHEAGWA